MNFLSSNAIRAKDFPRSRQYCISLSSLSPTSSSRFQVPRDWENSFNAGEKKLDFKRKSRANYLNKCRILLYIRRHVTQWTRRQSNSIYDLGTTFSLKKTRDALTDNRTRYSKIKQMPFAVYLSFPFWRSERPVGLNLHPMWKYIATGRK